MDDLSGETSLMPYSTQLLHSMLWGLFFGMEIFTYVGNASNQRTVCQTAIQSCCWKGRSPLSNESRLHVLKGGRRERWGGGQCLFVHRHRQRQSAAVAKRLRPPPSHPNTQRKWEVAPVCQPLQGGGHGSRLCERPHGVQEAGDVPGLRGEGSLAQLPQVAALRPLGGARQPQRSPQPPVTGPAADHAGDSRGTGGEAEGEKPSASPVRAAPA